jgi:hypothetical protein
LPFLPKLRWSRFRNPRERRSGLPSRYHLFGDEEQTLLLSEQFERWRCCALLRRCSLELIAIVLGAVRPLSGDHSGNRAFRRPSSSLARIFRAAGWRLFKPRGIRARLPGLVLAGAPSTSMHANSGRVQSRSNESHRRRLEITRGRPSVASFVPGAELVPRKFRELALSGELFRG